MPSRLAVGTVQFGIPYGITNQRGQVSRDEAARILGRARAARIDTLDTAIAYGESEQRLGELGVGDFRIISKLGDPPAGVGNVPAWTQASVAQSVDRLRVPSLGGLLVHRSHTLTQPNGPPIYETLLALKRNGIVGKVGVSIYDPEELERLAGYEFDIVQAPLSIMDRRLVESGWLDRLAQRGVEVHVRSVFLQGLLLSRAEDLPPGFERWRALWQRWWSWLEQHGRSAVEVCLGYVAAQRGVGRIIIGVENEAQLAEAIRASGIVIETWPDELGSSDLELISPLRWRTT